MSPGASRLDAKPRRTPWTIIRLFDAVHGHVERDPRIEDARDRVPIAAANLTEAEPAEAEPDQAILDDQAEGPGRERLVKTINDRAWIVPSRGTANRAGAP